MNFKTKKKNNSTSYQGIYYNICLCKEHLKKYLFTSRDGAAELNIQQKILTDTELPMPILIFKNEKNNNTSPPF